MTSRSSLPVFDRRKRPLRDLRVSVTDRCNFRCRYCMPREVFGTSFPFLPKREILSFEEITRVCRLSAELGVQKVRLTGGEPLLRAELPKLLRMLTAIPGLDVALTTNGSTLERHARALREAGLRRITISLDSLDPDVFRRLSDTDVPLSKVLAGIQAAADAGLSPIKINAVVRRGENEDDLLRLTAHFKGTRHILRFIEYMDVGSTNGWSGADVIGVGEMVERIDSVYPIEPIEPNYPGEVAGRFRFKDGSGELGFIASVTRPFCAQCTRARLSADGKLYTCLFASRGVDVRTTLRDGSSDEALREHLRSIWNDRDDRYSEVRAATSPRPKIEMSYIGG